MELWNKNDAFSTYYYNDGYYTNDGNKGYFDEANVRDWKIGAAGANDNHSGTWGTENNYRLAVLATAKTKRPYMRLCKTEDSLLHWIKI
jgi:hypothetical protein